MAPEEKWLKRMSIAVEVYAAIITAATDSGVRSLRCVPTLSTYAVYAVCTDEHDLLGTDESEVEAKRVIDLDRRVECEG